MLVLVEESVCVERCASRRVCVCVCACVSLCAITRPRALYHIAVAPLHFLMLAPPCDLTQ